MFRVTIRGVFDGLDDAQRTALTASSGPFQAAFTEAGGFTCDTGLSAFTFRCQVEVVEPDDGEQGATRRALAVLEAYGYPYRVLRTGVTDMRTIKVRRKGRRS
ncbi:DUF6204 family protein [Streptomyces cucumeris]|uniref:DUF6204 family protein n=1 Tax=Streptomyces cucumeris TaxID=2962890 RepID=UPI003EB92E18